jgi:hypothetical protein
MSEKVLAGSLNAIDACGTHNHLVEVHLQDLVLRKTSFDLECPPKLDQFSPNGDVPSIGVEGARQLLSNGGASAQVHIEHLSDDSPGKAFDGKSQMSVEGLVFPGDKGAYQMVGQLLYAHGIPFFRGKEFGYQAAFYIVEFRWQGRLEFGKIFCAYGVKGPA